MKLKSVLDFAASFVLGILGFLTVGVLAVTIYEHPYFGGVFIFAVLCLASCLYFGTIRDEI